MTALALRDYQRDAVAALYEAWNRGVNRGAVVLPTGTGKTVTFAGLIDQHVRQAGTRAVVIAHRDELIRQAHDKIHSVAPGIGLGIVQAQRNDVSAQCVVGSIQTLSRGRAAAVAAAGKVGLVIVDEAHHSAAKTYREVLETLGCFPVGKAAPTARLAGFSATLTRADGGLDEIFQEVVYQRDILDFVRPDGTGALLDARGIRVVVEDLNLAKVRRSGGDYSESDLGAAIVDSLAPEQIAKAYVEHCRRPDGSFRKGLLFAPTVEAAYVCADALNAAGVRAAGVDGRMALEERRAILARYFAGEIDVLANCMIFTEGFDCPEADVAVIARPTTSAALYVQMVGRVLRPFPGQVQALVMDVVGVGGRHRLATLADLTSKAVKLDDGQSLMEILEAEPDSGLGDEDGGLGMGLPYEGKEGDLVGIAFDLFGRSPVVWHQSAKKGAWFVGVGERVVMLMPSKDDPSHFAVGRASIKRVNGERLTEYMDMSMAFGWAEQLIREDPAYSFADKSASWRSGKASEAQKGYAASLGIKFPEDIRKTDLADMMTFVICSNRLDGLNMYAHLPNRTEKSAAEVAVDMASFAKAKK
jgi:superfamily II DNA or RNA helicase